MNYIENNTIPNEKILIKQYVSQKIFIILIIPIIGIIGTTSTILSTTDQTEIMFLKFTFLIFAILTIYVIIELGIRLTTTEYAITNKRIISKEGWIRLRTNEIKIDKIEGIRIKQNLIQAILNTGTITITGTGTNRVNFRTIDNPKKSHTIINETLANIDNKKTAKN